MGRSIGRQWAELLATNRQFRDRLWAGSHVRRQVSAGPKASGRETSEVEPQINADDGLHPGPHFETCGSTNPQVFPSHISSHLLARQSGTGRNGQRLKPLVASLSGTARNGQKRL